MPKSNFNKTANTEKISDAFVKARLNANHLKNYPGILPETLDDAYSAQFLSISKWGKPIAGWKVGGIPKELHKTHQETRIGGVFFNDMVYPVSAKNDQIDMPCFEGGFAAIEPELILEVGRTVAAGSIDPQKDDISDLISKVYMPTKKSKRSWTNIYHQ